jgi:four helix bundle protein
MENRRKVLKLTDKLPRKEDYGFTSQIKRSVLSISAKIADAYGRNHTADKVNFYYFSRGSITETQSHLEYGKIAGYFDNKVAEKLDKRLSDLYKNLNIYPSEGQTNDFLNLCLNLHY